MLAGLGLILFLTSGGPLAAVPTEIYNIVAGSGTFVTGGAVANAQDRTAGISGGDVTLDVDATSHGHEAEEG